MLPTTRRYVNQLTHGDSVDEVFLVADKQLRANRQGNLYLHLDLRDKTGAISARLWNASESLARRFEPGDYLQVRGKIQVFQGAVQIILAHIEVVNPSDVEPGEFLPQSAAESASSWPGCESHAGRGQSVPAGAGGMLPDRRRIRAQVHLGAGRDQEPSRLSRPGCSNTWSRC